MSSGMRRVRKDSRPKPKLPSATTSKAAPRLFTSSSRRNDMKKNNPKLFLPIYHNDTDSNAPSHTSKERKPLLTARTLKTSKDDNGNHASYDKYHHQAQLPSNQEREVTIEFMDDYNDVHKASDIMSFQSFGQSLVFKSRKSIYEIRKQYLLNQWGKLCAIVLIGMILLSKSWDALTHNSSSSSSLTKEPNLGVKVVYDKGPLNDSIRHNPIEKEVMDIATATSNVNENEKSQKLSSAENLIENIVNEEKTKSKQSKIYDAPTSSADKNTPTSTQKIQKKKKKKKKTQEQNLKEVPKLSGGVQNSFSMTIIPDIPKELGNFADISSEVNLENDKPFFWDIHLAGGTVVEHIFGKCLNLLQASELGIQHDFDDARFDESLQVLEMDGQNYLNIDTTTAAGLERAKSLDVLTDPLSPSVFYSPLIHEIGSIFTPSRRGRMFALFRHPMERAVGMYYYLQGATWDPLYDSTLSKISLEEYALSSLVENNWMTRFLVNKKGGKLNNEDLAAAKEIIRQKCLVGLFDKMEESMVRFEMYFGWRNKMSSKQKKCEKKWIKKGDDRHNHPMVEEGSSAWNALLQHNLYDMELYAYAKQVFNEQGELKKKK